ncbi:DNA sulfur modification protein DndD [Geobacillus stearothermophilus]|uniref:DNA sulfur modification protein DndD n=2 Tax=Geobacillus stearothermophilus TaxID=1422 RepID=UPI002E22211C|nr:DNA sulfur modification protein DndD [Geobacillus stearothermophilus]MED3732073.1 DNA sulfur modification protein DndD [Geobacillus stearothermophilus]
MINYNKVTTMQINQLAITNFGIYYGRNEFVFGNKKGRANIILIGGENGTGKTTFLSAIKLALYGPLFLGYKSANAKYIDFIKDKINIYSRAEGNKMAGVEIDFTLYNNGEPENYHIIRQWELTKETVKEHLQISRNGISLTDNQIEEFYHFLRRNLPPSLFDFLFFDGERVQQYVLDSQFEQNVKEAFMTLFNLDLFDTLKEDLLKYLKQDNIFTSLTQEQKEYTQIEYDLRNQENVIRNLEKRIAELKEQAKDVQVKIQELEREFSNKGGMIARERETLNEQVFLMEQEKKQITEKIKETAAELLPFLITQKLLQQTVTQIDAEERVERYNTLKEELNNETLPLLFKELSRHFRITDLDGREATSSFTEAMKEKLFQSMKPVGVNFDRFQFIHRMNSEQKQAIRDLFKQVRHFDGKLVDEWFARIQHLTDEIYTVKKRIEHSLTDESLKDIVNKLNEYTRLHEQIKYEIEANTAKLFEAQKFYQELMTKKEKVQKRIRQARKDENIFELCQKLSRVLSRYQEEQVKKYLGTVERYFLQMFNSLMRKGQFLNSFRIDPQTFEITMLNYSNKPVFKHSLSAGETQLFFLSLLWALLKASKRQIPFVLDTLFGRLDRTHKENLIQKYLPVVANQVIILSTNTEVDEYYYNQMKPYIQREFSLHYDRNSNRVRINDYYFFQKVRI